MSRAVRDGSTESTLLCVGNSTAGQKETYDKQILSSTTRQLSFFCAFNVSTTDPFIDPEMPHYCQRYAWSATFVGNMLGCVLTTCVLTGLPLILGINPKFFMLDV